MLSQAVSTSSFSVVGTGILVPTRDVTTSLDWWCATFDARVSALWPPAAPTWAVLEIGASAATSHVTTVTLVAQTLGVDKDCNGGDADSVEDAFSVEGAYVVEDECEGSSQSDDDDHSNDGAHVDDVRVSTSGSTSHNGEDGTLRARFDLFVPDVDEQAERLQQLGVNVLQPPRNQAWGVRNMTVLDVDGNIITLSACLSSNVLRGERSGNDDGGSHNAEAGTVLSSPSSNTPSVVSRATSTAFTASSVCDLYARAGALSSLMDGSTQPDDGFGDFLDGSVGGGYYVDGDNKGEDSERGSRDVGRQGRICIIQMSSEPESDDVYLWTLFVLERLIAVCSPYLQRNLTLPQNALADIRDSTAFTEWQEVVKVFRRLKLSSLTSAQERTCCLVNVYNCLHLHSCISKGTPRSTLSRMQWYKSATYEFSDVTVSLFSLEHSYIRARMSYPCVWGGFSRRLFTKLTPEDVLFPICPPPDPRLNFVLSMGTASSSDVRILYKEHLDEAMDNAMVAFLTQHYRDRDSTGSKSVSRKVVVLPELVKWYAKDFTQSGKPLNLLQALLELLPEGDLAHRLRSIVANVRRKECRVKLGYEPFSWTYSYRFDVSIVGAGEAF